MKLSFAVFILFMCLDAHAVWDMLVKANPDREYMNFFYQGYIPWFEKNFRTSLEFPGKNGKEFFNEAVKNINHWRVKEHEHFDQLLLGQAFKEGRPAYSISLYLHPEVRNHAYIKSHKLPFSPDYIEWDGKNLCFSHFISREQLEHFCGNKKFTSTWNARETKTFKNPFENLTEWEISSKEDGRVVKSFFFTKTLHMAFIPKEFYPYIMEHGAATHMPLDKYSIDKDGRMTVYYP